MDEKHLKDKIFKRYGDVDYQLISFNRSHDPIVIKCLSCGENIELKYLSNLFHPQRKNFCPHCAGTYNGNKVGRLLSFNEAQKRLDDKFNGEYRIIENSYQGWATKALVKHQCGKIFRVTPRDLLYHSHCPCISIKSKGEDLIKNFLLENNIIFEEQKRLPGMMKAPYDFYLPNYNLLIEFQGRQHYEAVDKFGGEEQLKTQQDIDLRKHQLAKKLNIDLLCISFKDKNKIKDILVQRLFRKEVDSSESKR